jgi:hypothetical protein
VTWRFGASAADSSFTQSNGLSGMLRQAGRFVRNCGFGRGGKRGGRMVWVSACGIGKLGLCQTTHTSRFDTMYSHGFGRAVQLALRRRMVSEERRFGVANPTRGQSGNRFPLCRFTQLQVVVSAARRWRDAQFASADRTVRRNQQNWRLRSAVSTRGASVSRFR